MKVSSKKKAVRPSRVKSKTREWLEVASIASGSKSMKAAASRAPAANGVA